MLAILCFLTGQRAAAEENVGVDSKMSAVVATLETSPVATYPHYVACKSGSQCGIAEECLAGN